mgnify:CR=1 FL=1
MRPLDELLYVEGAIKSAITGDLLGITAVFMPSGFVVATPTANPLGGGVGYVEPYAYRAWLPKRRWTWMPRLIDDSGWVKALPEVEVGAKEMHVSGAAMMLLGAGALEL